MTESVVAVLHAAEPIDERRARMVKLRWHIAHLEAEYTALAAKGAPSATCTPNGGSDG